MTYSHLPILALIRAGALDKAWNLFRASGFQRETSDPALLCLHGKLLKETARASPVAKQKSLYREASNQYLRAAKISKTSYPLINAATLAFLANQKDQAARLALKVLEQGPDAAETAYWRAATEAEALLLLGRTAEASTALKHAVCGSPAAYEDHAATLRQFSLILSVSGADQIWLDTFRPPTSVHFAGPMSLVRADEKKIRDHLRRHLEKERVGFAYGALAAGADIILAEELVQSRAELHVILPSNIKQFRRDSVTRFGDCWGSRFDTLLKSACSVLIPARGDHELQLGIRLAAEVAMGSAAMNASSLQTLATQLIGVPRSATPSTDYSSSLWMAARWRRAGRPQLIVEVHRSPARPKQTAALSRQRVLAGLVNVALPSDSASVAKTLATLRRVLRASRAAPLVPPRWTDKALILAFRAPSEAAHFVSLCFKGCGRAIKAVAHYGLANRVFDPFSRQYFLAGNASEHAQQIFSIAPAGAFYASEEFIAALSIDRDSLTRSEYVGDILDNEKKSCKIFAISAPSVTE